MSFTVLVVARSASGQQLACMWVLRGTETFLRNRDWNGWVRRSSSVPVSAPNGAPVSTNSHLGVLQHHRALNFSKVIVIDNDMTFAGNIDELADAEAPAMVWHTATVLPNKERALHGWIVRAQAIRYRSR